VRRGRADSAKRARVLRLLRSPGVNSSANSHPISSLLVCPMGETITAVGPLRSLTSGPRPFSSMNSVSAVSSWLEAGHGFSGIRTGFLVASIRLYSFRLTSRPRSLSIRASINASMRITGSRYSGK
jgi:hypothetical protein